MTYFAEKHAKAQQAIDDWVAGSYAGAKRATPAQLAEHGLGEEYTGWVIPIENDARLTFAIDPSFPFSRPKTAIAGLGELALSPHVERHARLCTWGDASAFDPDAPAEVARGYIEASLQLLADNQAGGDVSDYSVDFEAYWRRQTTSNFRLLTMVSPEPPSRSLVGWFGQTQIILGETKSDCTRWLRNVFGEKIQESYGPSALIWLDPLPTPAEYPDTPSALRQLVKSRAASDLPLLDGVLTSTTGRRAVLLAGPATASRNAFGALVIQDPPLRHKFGGAALDHGFRKGKIPAAILASRLTSDRVEPEDVEASWTRLEPGIFEQLRSKKVAVIGCGAVGSSVARILAQTGVGRLVLIDPDILRWENISRHELGAEYVLKNKAIALASRLTQSLPHMIECVGHGLDWVSLAREQEGLFDDCNVVVAATGDWLSESALDDFTRSRAMVQPIVYGWLERRAMAAHALALNKDTVCFKCGFDNFGEPVLPATSWLSEEDNEQCAAVSSPFGAAELSFGNGLISGLVIDLLLERAVLPAHRIWLARTQELERQGGYWSQAWKDGVSDPGGGMMVGVDWPQRGGCICA